MTNEYRELTERLAKAMNFPGGAFVLITREQGKNTVDLVFKGNSGIIAHSITSAVNKILTELPDKYALAFREMLKNAIIADEKKRYQAAEMGD